MLGYERDISLLRDNISSKALRCAKAWAEEAEAAVAVVWLEAVP